MSKAFDSVRRELQSRRSALAAELERIDTALAGLASLDGEQSADQPGSWTSLGIVAAARRLLRERGEPMSSRELADEMRRRGVRTASKRLVTAVYVVLRGSPHFEFDKALEKWRLGPKETDTPSS